MPKTVATIATQRSRCCSPLESVDRLMDQALQGIQIIQKQ